MRFWGKRTVKVRHWRQGYQHDHVGVSAEDALVDAMKCAGHSHPMRAAALSVAMMRVNNNRLEYVPQRGNPEIYRIVERGKDW